MVFLRLNDDNTIGTRYHQPFDPVNGIHMTQEEAEKVGVFIESEDVLPVPNHQLGKDSILKYDTVNKTFYYEYVDRVMSAEEKALLSITQDMEAQKQALLELSMMVSTGGAV